MNYIHEMLEHNKQFVKDKLYEVHLAAKFPSKKIAILSCMDTRLTELLPAALNYKNGDIIIIKNAGAIITNPFGSVMRSLMVSVFELGVEDIIVMGHFDCGMLGLNPSNLIQKMLERNIPQEKIDFLNYCGVDINKWLKGFNKTEDSVLETVKIIKSHPLMPSDVRVHGFIINPKNGELDVVYDANTTE